MTVVDSHAHIFQHWSGFCGLPSREVHLKYLRKTLTRPSAKVYRLRDGAPASGQLLFRPGDNTWAGLRDDIEFRPGPYGGLEFRVDGEDDAVQYMPVDYIRRYCEVLSESERDRVLGGNLAELLALSAPPR